VRILDLRHRVLTRGGVDAGAFAAAHPVVAVAHLKPSGVLHISPLLIRSTISFIAIVSIEL
jgi:hypothetical protein